MKNNIYDIAQLAGVSIATVSLALNNRKGVSEKTRNKVLSIAKELNFTPSVVSVSNILPRKKCIALFMSGPDYNYFSSTFYTDSMKYFTTEMTDTEYYVVLKITTLSHEAEEILALSKDSDVNGIVFFSVRTSAAYIHELIPNIPCIFVNRPNIHIDNMYSVCADNEHAAYLLTKHLIDLGHRDIAFLGYLPGVISTEERIKGYLRSFAESGLTVSNDRIIQTEHFQETAYIQMRKMLNSQSLLPTAVICGNDLMAIGVMEALWDAGYEVPQKMSVAGIHNIPHTNILRVPLTTIKVPHDKIGTITADHMKRILNGEEVEKNTILPVELLCRSSTAYLSDQ